MSAEKLDTRVRREQIAQAAVALIARDGLRKLSVGAVARRVGVVPSALYRHFKSKDDILQAVLDLLAGRLMGNVQAVCQETSDPTERLRRLLMRHIQLIRENQAIPRIIFSDEFYDAHPDRRGRLYRVLDEYLQAVSKIIVQGQDKRLIRSDLDARTASMLFIGIVQPAAVFWHISNGNFDVTRHAAKAWRVFLDAIRSPPGAASGRASITRKKRKGARR